MTDFLASLATVLDRAMSDSILPWSMLAYSMATSGILVRERMIAPA